MKDENSEICHLIGFIRYINDMPDSKNNIKIKRELNMQDDNYELEYEDEDELEEDEIEQEEYFFINDISDDKYKCVFHGTESDFLKKVDDTDNQFKITNLNDLSYFTYESLDDLFDNLTMQRNPLALTQALMVSNEDIDRCRCFYDILDQAFGMGEYDDYLEANFYENFDKFDGLKFTTEAEAKNAIIVAFLLSNEYYVITNPRSSYGDDEDYDEIIMYEELINDNLFQKYTDSSFENDKVKILKCENLKLLIEKYIDYDSPTIEFIYNIHKKNDNDNILIKEVLFNYFNDSNYIDKHLDDLLRKFKYRNEKHTLKNEIDLEKAMFKCFNFRNELEVQFFKDNNIDLKTYMGDKFINLREELKKDYVSNLLQTKTKKLKM
ncbi:hypothetical protein [Shewanella baltica]|uniref:hypothetical protein n=1 Tax=Shewanella baltica TaxID=62322 RepID=UPI003D7AF0EE